MATHARRVFHLQRLLFFVEVSAVVVGLFLTAVYIIKARMNVHYFYTLVLSLSRSIDRRETATLGTKARGLPPLAMQHISYRSLTSSQLDAAFLEVVA